MYVMFQPGDGGSRAPTAVAHPAGCEGTWCSLSREKMGAALPSQLCVAFGDQSSQKALWLHEEIHRSQLKGRSLRFTQVAAELRVGSQIMELLGACTTGGTKGWCWGWGWGSVMEEGTEEAGVKSLACNRQEIPPLFS